MPAPSRRAPALPLGSVLASGLAQVALDWRRASRLLGPVAACLFVVTMALFAGIGFGLLPAPVGMNELAVLSPSDPGWITRSLLELSQVLIFLFLLPAATAWHRWIILGAAPRYAIGAAELRYLAVAIAPIAIYVVLRWFGVLAVAMAAELTGVGVDWLESRWVTEPLVFVVSALAMMIVGSHWLLLPAAAIGRPLTLAEAERIGGSAGRRIGLVTYLGLFVPLVAFVAIDALLEIVLQWLSGASPRWLRYVELVGYLMLRRAWRESCCCAR